MTACDFRSVLPLQHMNIMVYRIADPISITHIYYIVPDTTTTIITLYGHTDST